MIERVSDHAMSLFSRDRSILLELSLGKTVMTSADEIDAQITVVNRYRSISQFCLLAFNTNGIDRISTVETS